MKLVFHKFLEMENIYAGDDRCRSTGYLHTFYIAEFLLNLRIAGDFKYIIINITLILTRSIESVRHVWLEDEGRVRTATKVVIA